MSRQELLRSSSTADLRKFEANANLAPIKISKFRWRLRLTYLQHWVRTHSQKWFGLPVARWLLRRWMGRAAGWHHIEALGMPRHAMEEELGDDVLTLYVDPRKLVRLAVRKKIGSEKKPSSLRFIWDGTWDLRREDLRLGSRYQFISDLAKHREDLSVTRRSKELLACLEKGEPWGMHQKGILLETPAKIERYLQAYIGFLDNMAAHGFNRNLGKDSLGVAISRDGRILKINRGLHRLAMAQYLGLPTIPVRVQHVHREWWNKVTDGAEGQQALDRVKRALRDCVPAEDPGPLDIETSRALPLDFWPVAIK